MDGWRGWGPFGVRTQARPERLELHSIQGPPPTHRQVLPPALGQQAPAQSEDVCNICSLCLVTFHRPYVSYYQTYANLRFDEIIQFWHVAWSPRCTRAALMQPWYARNRSFTYLSCLCFWFDRKYRNYTLCQTMQFSVFHHWYSMFSSPFTMLLSFKLYRSCLWISSRVCYKKC